MPAEFERGAALVRGEPQGEQPSKNLPPRSARTLDTTKREDLGMNTGLCICLTFEFTRLRRLAKPAVAGRVQRRVRPHSQG